MTDNYATIWVNSARKCRPTEEWHWNILARDYQEEFQWVRSAFIGEYANTTPPDRCQRGEDWKKIGKDARLIAAAIAKRFTEHNRYLPYVNSLWLVDPDKMKEDV